MLFYFGLIFFLKTESASLNCSLPFFFQFVQYDDIIIVKSKRTFLLFRCCKQWDPCLLYGSDSEVLDQGRSWWNQAKIQTGIPIFYLKIQTGIPISCLKIQTEIPISCLMIQTEIPISCLMIQTEIPISYLRFRQGYR